MNKNKFEKQPSGLLNLNFDHTPNNKPFEIPIKDTMDQFSFTLKSKDDTFANNQGFSDYEFSSFALKGDKTNKNKISSPMTRRQWNKEVDKLKDTIRKASPDRFSIDWDKISHCPCCKQKLPEGYNPENSPVRSPRSKSRFAKSATKANGSGTKRNREEKDSQDSDFRIEKLVKKAEEDPNANKRRKTKHQVKMLEAELEANPHWTNDDMAKIAKKTGLSKSQVYKWNWDQKKKLNILPSKVYVVQLPSDLIDSKTGQLLLKSHDGLKKLQTINLESVGPKSKGK